MVFIELAGIRYIRMELIVLTPIDKCCLDMLAHS